VLAALLLVGACGTVERADVVAPRAAPAGQPAGAVEVAAAPESAGWTCPGPCRRWRGVLHGLDRHRTRAYAQGDPALLSRVYLPGTRVLAADRRMLAAWIDRGATVSGVRLRVLRADRLGRTVGAGARLRVVDRLGPAVAHLPDGRQRALPRDRPTERVVVLVRTRHGWRIAASRPWTLRP
jgi:hypothetical protein